MLLEKTQGPLSRLNRRLFVVAPACIAVEAVPRLIPVDFNLGMCGVKLLHLLRRNMRILLAEMQHHRRTRRLVCIVTDPSSVVPHRRRGMQPCRGHPRQGSAEAVADHANLLPGCAPSKLHRGCDVRQSLLRIELRYKTQRPLHIGALVAKLHSLLNAVKERRSHHQESVLCITVRYRADVRVDPEYLLYHHEPDRKSTRLNSSH